MKRRNAVMAAGAAAAAPLAAWAQSGRPLKRIGFFNLAPAHVDAPYLTAFHAGMVEQGPLDGGHRVITSYAGSAPLRRLTPISGSG